MAPEACVTATFSCDISARRLSQVFALVGKITALSNGKCHCFPAGYNVGTGMLMFAWGSGGACPQVTL